MENKSGSGAMDYRYDGVEDSGRASVIDNGVAMKANGKGWKIATAVLAALLVGVSGVLIWKLLANPGDDKSTADCPELAEGVEVADVAFMNQDAAVREIVAAAKEKTLELLDPYRGVLIDVYDTEVPYKPEGFLTPIQLGRGYGFRQNSSMVIAGTELYDKVNKTDWANELGKFLEGQGFVSAGEAYTTASAGPGDTPYYNEKTGVVCAVTMAPWISCSYKDWYDKADAELSNKLAEVFEAATGEDVRYLVARVEYIQDSSVAPYQRISVGRSGYGSSFYRVSPEAEWVYFSSGQDAPVCSAYNTEDLKKAFAGTRCYDESKQDYVELSL